MLSVANIGGRNICNEEHKDLYSKVRDHDHFTGICTRRAHLTCNTNFYYEKCLQVFFYNLRGYDSHFIIQ